MKMNTYKYTGANTTGVTLEVNDEVLEVMLFPGRPAELSEEHPWVKRMVRRGFLTLVESGDANSKKINAKAEAVPAPEPAEGQAALQTMPEQKEN